MAFSVLRIPASLDRIVAVTMSCVCLSLASGQETPDSPTDQLRREAQSLRPLVHTPAVGAFLDATASLPRIEARVVYRDRKRRKACTEAQFNQLAESDQAHYERTEYGGEFYYYTGYGSPLVYARVLDIVGQHGFVSYAGKRIMDFGYGSIGQLRLLASLGADAVGTEVQPVFPALYSHPGDQGNIPGPKGIEGKLTLIDGRFPADPDVKRKVGGGYDLFTSKNTLKRGYIHPEREADPRTLVDLGVDDPTFVRSLFDMLKPGGLAIIYNLSPAQNPPDKPYIPWADGRCPFDRDLLEKAGFQVLAYDEPDNETAFDFWFALGYNEGKPRAQLAKELFTHYTLLRRPLPADR